MKTGITGATGQLGQLVVENLKKRAAAGNFVALARDPGKAASLGIEARSFDYDKPGTLEEALKGIEQLLLISGSEIGKRKQQHENVIRAAKAAGVKRIVYTSLLHAGRSTLSLADEHRATEIMLKSSGIGHTILRNGWYTENYTGNLKASAQAGALAGCAGEGKISSAARKDYAEAAAAVLTETGHEGKTYELAGDDYYTLGDLAKEVSRQTGKDIPYHNLSEEAYTAALVGAGLPESLAKAYAGFDTGAAKNDLYDDSRQLSKLIGRPTTPLSEMVKLALR